MGSLIGGGSCVLLLLLVWDVAVVAVLRIDDWSEAVLEVIEVRVDGGRE
jgi:hypothetical protein